MMQGAALQHKPSFILINYQPSHFTDIFARVQMENLGRQMCGASLRLTGLQAKGKLIILKPGKQGSVKFRPEDEHVIRITLLLENSSDLPFKSFPWKEE